MKLGCDVVAVSVGLAVAAPARAAAWTVLEQERFLSHNGVAQSAAGFGPFSASSPVASLDSSALTPTSASANADFDLYHVDEPGEAPSSLSSEAYFRLRFSVAQPMSVRLNGFLRAIEYDMGGCSDCTAQSRILFSGPGGALFSRSMGSWDFIEDEDNGVRGFDLFFALDPGEYEVLARSWANASLGGAEDEEFDCWGAGAGSGFGLTLQPWAGAPPAVPLPHGAPLGASGLWLLACARRRRSR